MRFEQPTICFETEVNLKNGRLISPRYILSDRLQVEVKLWFFVLVIRVSFGAIFMSVNIAERPTFEKEQFTLTNVCSQM